VALYKLGLAALLLVIEFLLARFTGLDMTRFMAWNVSNVVGTRVVTLYSTFFMVISLISSELAPGCCVGQQPDPLDHFKQR
jgi:hypothetical protein